MSAPSPAHEWIRQGRGLGPSIKWSHQTDGPLTSLSLARESGDVIVADASGSICRMDRGGQIAALNRFREPVHQLCWSDDGSAGAALVGDDTLYCLDRTFQSVWTVNLPDVCMAVSITPYGRHVAASLADGTTLIYDANRRRVATIETIRPLAFLSFCTTKPVLIGAAEHALVTAYSISGAEVWQEKMWSNVGDIAVTGDGSSIHLASFAHGIQTLDSHGESVGSYVLEGTVNHVAVSFEPQRLIAASFERSLYWLDPDGAMLWTAAAPDDVVALECDPLGEWAVCGLAGGTVMRLDWGGV